MTAKLRHILTWLADAFWLVPALMVLCGAVLAFALVAVDRSDLVPQALVASAWLYNGGATGARTLLGAGASSTIGVAGMAFSITIAALSLAAGQMGPRLLRNFVRDRGNQATLGTFLATFVYALVRHADLVMADAERSVGNPADLDDVRKRYSKVADAPTPAAHAGPRRRVSA